MPALSDSHSFTYLACSSCVLNRLPFGKTMPCWSSSSHGSSNVTYLEGLPLVRYAALSSGLTAVPVRHGRLAVVTTHIRRLGLDMSLLGAISPVHSTVSEVPSVPISSSHGSSGPAERVAGRLASLSAVDRSSLKRVAMLRVLMFLLPPPSRDSQSNSILPHWSFVAVLLMFHRSPYCSPSSVAMKVLGPMKLCVSDSHVRLGSSSLPSISPVSRGRENKVGGDGV
mmetsp:Transcript_40044/g.100190  ORF Transcript_40044/g.100190 Transcript_40044/m.100190 type:complete len:226 (+) Transcript_40044:1489-2166(+)